MGLWSPIYSVLIVRCSLHMKNVALSSRSFRLQALELQNEIVTWLWESLRSSSKARLAPSIYMLHT